jgi:hypothetical protein
VQALREHFPIKRASGFVTCDGHGNALADASPHHVPHCRSPHVVEDQADISAFGRIPRSFYLTLVWVLSVNTATNKQDFDFPMIKFAKLIKFAETDYLIRKRVLFFL